MLLLSLLSLLLPEAHARCAERHTADELRRVSRVALQEYAADRLAGFYQANAVATAWIPCLAELATADSLAPWYAAQGLQAFLDRRPTDMERDFQIARYLDPELTLPEGLAPRGHPIDVAWTNALLAPPFGEVSVEGNFQGDLYIDGVLSLTMPAERPYVAQLMSTDHVLKGSWLVPDLAQAPDRLTGERNLTWSRRFALGAAGVSTVSAGLWVAALSSSSTASTLEQDAPTLGVSDPDRRSRQRTLEDVAARANALGYAAQVTTGLGVGLATVSLVVRF